jgi:choline transport protein
MGAVVLVLTWACSAGITTSASRMTWAFARDMGMPFSSILKRVDRRTKVPVIAVGVVVVLACLLSLIYIGSPTAFNDVISLTITGFYGSYLVPSALLLYHRVKGNILPYGSVVEGERVEGGDEMAESSPVTLESNPDDDHHPVAEEKPKLTPQEPSSPEEVQSSPPRRVTFAPSQLVWGPWRLPGLVGIINNAYACIYMLFVIFWSVWPPSTPVSPSTMNYSVVVTGGVILFSIVWYYIRGRKEYQGPLVDREVAEIIRAGRMAEV